MPGDPGNNRESINHPLKITNINRTMEARPKGNYHAVFNNGATHSRAKTTVYLYPYFNLIFVHCLGPANRISLQVVKSQMALLDFSCHPKLCSQFFNH